MGKLEFEELLKQESAPITEAEQNRQEHWLKAVDQFYKKVKGWLDPFKKKGLLTYQMGEVTLTEDFVGTYVIDVMQLRFGKHLVKFQPMGKDIIGAHGRIDMTTERGTLSFFLEEDDIFSAPPQLVWKTLFRHAHGNTSEILDEESFFNILTELAGG